MSGIVINPYAFAGGGGGGSFSPTDVDGLRSWLDADDASTLTVDGATGRVTQWDDKSGNGYHATQGTPGNAPELIASGLNGRDVLRFSANGDYTLLAQTGILTKAQPTYVFLAVNADNTNNCYILSNEASSERSQVRIHSGNIYLISGAFADTGLGFSSSPSVLTAVFNGTSSLARLNGTASGAVDAGTRGWDGHVIGTLNGNRDSFQYNGDIGEIIVYNHALTSSEVDDIESYLADKWGITL